MSDNTSSATARKTGPWWKRLLQNLTLSAGVFLLCLVASEIVLRLAGYGNLEIYEADSKLYWRLKPGQDCFTKVNRRPVHVNAQGIRGPEFLASKPPRTFRVLSLGDSRTFGWGLADEETYSRRLEKLLEDLRQKTDQPSSAGQRSPSPDGMERTASLAFRKATRVEVINAGVNAWSYAQMAVYLREYGLRYQPDLVVLGEANLWTQFSEKNSPEFVKKFMWRVRLKNFLRRFAIYHYVVEIKLRDFYGRNRVKFIPVDPKQDTLFKEQQQSDPDAFFRDAIADVCRTAASNHIQAVILYLPLSDELTNGIHSRVLLAKQETSRDLNVPLCDVSSKLREEKRELYLDADPVHLNARGNEIVAKAVFETVTRVIVP
jgi:hypothetical protein